MSEIHNIINNSVQDRAPFTSDTVLNKTSGKSFTAEIEGNLDPFTIPESLGTDPRAKFRLHVTNETQALSVSMNDLIQFKLFGSTINAKIVYRDFDPASPQTKFIAVNLLSKDAQ